MLCYFSHVTIIIMLCHLLAKYAGNQLAKYLGTPIILCMCFVERK